MIDRGLVPDTVRNRRGTGGKVVTRISETVGRREHDTTVMDVAEPGSVPAVDDFDAVVVGPSIHAEKYQTAIVEFVRSNRDGAIGTTDRVLPGVALVRRR